MTDLHIPASPVLRGGDSLSGNLDDSVYNRLLRERIIFLGSEVTDQVANRICAQLLLLSAEDPERDEPAVRHDWHTHDVAETLTVLDGALDLFAQGCGRTCVAGDQILLPAGLVHASRAGENGALYAIQAH